MGGLTPLSSVVQLEPRIQTVDEPPATRSKVLLDLLFEDLHRILEELRHRLDHLDQGHLIVAAAVLVSFLKASVTVEARLVIVRLVDKDEACTKIHMCVRNVLLNYKSCFNAEFLRNLNIIQTYAVWTACPVILTGVFLCFISLLQLDLSVFCYSF